MQCECKCSCVSLRRAPEGERARRCRQRDGMHAHGQARRAVAVRRRRDGQRGRVLAWRRVRASAHGDQHGLSGGNELLAELDATRAHLRELLVEAQASTPSPGPSVSTIVEAMGPCLPPGEEWQRIAPVWADFVVRVRCGRVAAAPASSSDFELRAGGVGLLVSFTVENTDEGAVRHTIAAKRLLL